MKNKNYSILNYFFVSSYHVVVKGLHVRDGKEVSTQWKSGAAFLRCMVWKDDMLAFGDSAGRVGVWDLAKTQCRQSGLSQSTRGPVLRIVFSKLAGDYTLTVFFIKFLKNM